MASVSAGIVHWSLVINRLADVVSALSQDVSEKVSRRFSLSAFSLLFLPPYCALVILRIPASSCVL